MHILHLSDLHFPRIEAGHLRKLKNFVAGTAIDLILVTGDITMRAKKESFLEARNFFAGLQPEKIFLPGNHDIPLYRIWERVNRPFGNYRRYFWPDLEPEYISPDLVLASLNSVRSRLLVRGRLSQAQLKRLKDLFQQHKDKAKLLAIHHPLLVPPYLKKNS